MANKIMEVTKLLGLEPFEEFKIKDYATSKFRFTDSELQVINYGKWVEANTVILGYLIYGREIIHLPYQPKDNERYYTYVCEEFRVQSSTWSNCAIDYCRLKAGIVFRTEKEAREKQEEKMRELTGI